MFNVCITGEKYLNGRDYFIWEVKDFLKKAGYKVLMMPDLEKELASYDICPDEELSAVKYQKIFIQKWIANKNLFESITSIHNTVHPNDTVIVLHDGGILDSIDDCTADSNLLLKTEGFHNKKEVANYYDMVVYLTTGDERDESGKLTNWLRNDHFVVCGVTETRHDEKVTWDTTEKASEIVKKIFNRLNKLGEQLPQKIQRKYLIEELSDEQMTELGCGPEEQVLTSRLVRSDKSAFRCIRMKTKKGCVSRYFYAEKERIDDNTIVEREMEIKPDEYLKLLLELDTKMREVGSTHREFTYKGRKFLLRINDFAKYWLETEVETTTEKVELPPVKVILPPKNMERVVFVKEEEPAKEKTKGKTKYTYYTGHYEKAYGGVSIMQKTCSEKAALQRLKESGEDVNFMSRQSDESGSKVEQYDATTGEWVVSDDIIPIEYIYETGHYIRNYGNYLDIESTTVRADAFKRFTRNGMRINYLCRKNVADTTFGYADYYNPYTGLWEKHYTPM